MFTSFSFLQQKILQGFLFYKANPRMTRVLMNLPAILGISTDRTYRCFYIPDLLKRVY